MEHFWIFLITVPGTILSSVMILKPDWLKQGQEITTHDRERYRNMGISILSLIALSAVPDAHNRIIGYLFCAIALCWFVLAYRSNKSVWYTVGAGIVLGLLLIAIGLRHQL